MRVPSYLSINGSNGKPAIRVFPDEPIRKLIPQVPYRTGGNITLRLAILPQSHNLSYKWRILQNGGCNPIYNGEGDISSGVKSHILRLPFMVWSGEYVIELCLPDYDNKYTPIVCFDVLSRDEVFSQVAIGCGLLIIGGVLGWFLNKLLGG